jgi:hypothetical protein
MIALVAELVKKKVACATFLGHHPGMESEKLPIGLLSSDELSERLQKSHRFPVPASRIVELAVSGHLPCWWWQDGETRHGPYFQIGRVKDWLVQNGWICEQSGIPFPGRLVVQLTPPSSQQALRTTELPTVLRGMACGLFPVNHTCPGVYFLICGDDVVYVGQSLNVAARVSSHISEKKKAFDKAVYLPVPQSDLNLVERAFIRALRPLYNDTNNGCRVTDEDAMWVRTYGGVLRQEQGS